jgi:hypothetical protein
MADDGVFLGKAKDNEYLLLRLANRHGLVAGATGTGKPSPCRCWRKAFPRPVCRSSLPM